MKSGTRVCANPAVLSDGTVYMPGKQLTNTQEGTILNGTTVKWDSGFVAENLPVHMLKEIKSAR